MNLMLECSGEEMQFTLFSVFSSPQASIAQVLLSAIYKLAGLKPPCSLTEGRDSKVAEMNLTLQKWS